MFTFRPPSKNGNGNGHKNGNGNGNGHANGHTNGHTNGNGHASNGNGIRYPEAEVREEATVVAGSYTNGA